MKKGWSSRDHLGMGLGMFKAKGFMLQPMTVSYTHLTLPTNREV